MRLTARLSTLGRREKKNGGGGERALFKTQGQVISTAAATVTGCKPSLRIGICLGFVSMPVRSVALKVGVVLADDSTIGVGVCTRALSA